MWELIIKILELISPQLRETIGKALDEWEVKAKTTPSMADDLLVMLLKKLLGF